MSESHVRIPEGGWNLISSIARASPVNLPNYGVKLIS